MNAKFETVFITGANRGLGLEIVKQLSSLPNPPLVIYATCRNPPAAKDLQNIADLHSNVKILQLDVTDHCKFPAIRQQLDEEIGDIGLNLLINNAGIHPQKITLDKVTIELMRDCYEVNVIGPLLLTKELLPLLKTSASKSNIMGLSAKRSSVVNITSSMGSLEINISGGSYSYRPTKTALNMVSKSLSIDLEKFGILVFSVHPGWIKTDMGGEGAQVELKTSVEGVLNIITNSKEEYAGRIIDYQGKMLPY